MVALLPHTRRVRPRTTARRPRAMRACPVPVLAVVACLALLGRPAPAAAHARLTKAQPADGAVVATPPATIELWFNELLDDEFNSVAVHRAKGGAPADETDLAAGPPRVDDADRTHLTTPVGPLPPGEYVVQWKVLSRDGHSARGRVRFRVAGDE